ncbi:MAG: isoleucine--tRNA ligase [Firmicutes bacterium]|nr:isoleucine--tRNA ligase [Bacillota bacterium]
MKNFNFIDNERRVLDFWNSINVFEKMVDKNKDSKKRFKFLDGPITANGSMCMHHVWGRTLKDVHQKYHTLKGYSTQFQNGFDAQGMWVEVEVEKLLGLKSKKDIQDYGMDKFTEKCMERVEHFADMQTRQSIRLGQIMDWDNSYYTNSDHNITSIWHFLKVCHERNMIIKSYKAMPWCPRCGTSLSEHEMNGSYKEVTHRAVFSKLPIVGKNEKILIWTTTPWTLSANVAVAINPNDMYLKVRVKSDKDLIIVGKDALKKLGEDKIEVVAEIKGSELVGLSYEKPLVFKNVNKGDGTIIPWDDVSASEGSGAVHIAPGCGAEDFELSKIHNLTPIIPVNEAGIFTDEFDYLGGLTTEQAQDVVFDKLTQDNKMYFTHPYSHSYPFCWRCKTDVVFRLVDGWDIATKDIKPEIFAAIDTVEWKPPYLKKMMTDWITNMGDWNISRRRFYGLPLPFYPCAKCGHLHVVGGLDELEKLAINPQDVKKIPHLHRPYIDEIRIKCAKCSAHVARVPDVGDCWLDAGIAPFATKKYFTDRKYWEENFPSDMVTEMKEQIRLWFYAQLFMSVVLTGKSPFKTLVGYNTMLDEDGKKFSKTGPKNIPFDVAVETWGADAMRYVFASANPTLDMRFGPSMIDEAKRKLMAFLNSVSFYKTYADIDKPKPSKHVPKDLDVTDIWLVETMNDFIKDVDVEYSNYAINKVVVLVEKFVEDLSNFYIRTNRRRFWKGERGQDKNNAYWALYSAIRAITIAMAPLTPFMSEHIWQELFAKEEGVQSVLVTNFPTPIKLEKSIKGITDKVEFIKNVTTLAHSLRAKEGIKVRQPLEVLYIKSTDKDALKLFDEYLRDELNVKKVELVKDDSTFNTPYLTVNFKKAGAVLGGDVQKLKAALESLDDKQMAKAVSEFTKGKVKVGAFKDLSAELFEKKSKPKPEYVAQTEGELTVVLDTTLSDELVAEGKLRELIRAIQVARQDADLDITARIELGLLTKDKGLQAIIEKHTTKIMDEVLAKKLTDKVSGGKTATTDIDGAEVKISFHVV